jgi:hypothetical protein
LHWSALRRGPCRDDSCGKKEDRDASSIQLKSTQPRDRSDGASHILVDDLPPGLSTKDELPPGLLERDEKDELPPGLRDDGRAHEWRKRIATVPAVPTQDPGSGSLPIPEPTGSSSSAAASCSRERPCAADEARRLLGEPCRCRSVPATPFLCRASGASANHIRRDSRRLAGHPAAVRGEEARPGRAISAALPADEAHRRNACRNACGARLGRIVEPRCAKTGLLRPREMT